MIHIQKATDFLESLLKPHELGLSATPEIRDRARECLGIKACETGRNFEDVDDRRKSATGEAVECERVQDAPATIRVPDCFVNGKPTW